MSIKWMDRKVPGYADIGSRVADASHALIATLRDANQAVARRGSAGWSSARALGDDVLTKGRNARKSTAGFIAERPLESVLIIGLAGVAIGWILRRAQESRANHSSSSAPRAAKSRSRKAPLRKSKPATR
ncbi:MAG: hypothetical protein WB784_11785 [Rhodanobacteraceae bacterium]